MVVANTSPSAVSVGKTGHYLLHNLGPSGSFWWLFSLAKAFSCRKTTTYSCYMPSFKVFAPILFHLISSACICFMLGCM